MPSTPATTAQVSWLCGGAPVYATSFIEELTAYPRRVFPGKQFGKIAPPVPTPKL